MQFKINLLEVKVIMTRWEGFGSGGSFTVNFYPKAPKPYPLKPAIYSTLEKRILNRLCKILVDKWWKNICQSIFINSGNNKISLKLFTSLCTKCSVHLNHIFKLFFSDQWREDSKMVSILFIVRQSRRRRQKLFKLMKSRRSPECYHRLNFHN